jgi:hypothetical protein
MGQMKVKVETDKTNVGTGGKSVNERTDVAE